MRFYIQIILFILILPVFAEDMSELYFTVNTSTTKTYVQILVEDPLGRKSGCIDICFKEISDSSFGKDSIDDVETGESGIEVMTVRIGPVVKGIYRINVLGNIDTRYEFSVSADNSSGKGINLIQDLYTAYVSRGTNHQYILDFDPTPGAPVPVIKKEVTYQLLREDLDVAYKLNQIGEDKFVNSLTKMIDIAEKLAQRCKKMEDRGKGKEENIKVRCYKPVVAILRMFVKRLEVVNRLCDKASECKARCKKKEECDEDEAFKGFENKYGRDNDFKEFFEEWDKDEYQIHKKTCKKYITDEALEIITTDINWLIKGFGEDIWENYKKEHNPYISEKQKNLFK